MCLRLGVFGSQLQTAARYLKQVDSEGDLPRWTTITFDQWRAENPRSQVPEIGVVEVLVGSGHVSWGHFDDLDAQLFSRQSQAMMMAPTVIARANASTVFSAIDSMMAEFSISKVQT